MSDEEGREAFLNLAGEDGEIDAYELQNILNQVFTRDFNFDGFSVDMTRSMVAMRDVDLSGKLGFEDFKQMWYDLALCKRAFQVLDADGSGHFNVAEFERALEALGMTASEGTIQAMMARYSDKAGNVKFDDFVACFIKLKSMQKTYEAKDVDNSDCVEFSLDEYVQLGVYS